MGIDEILRTHFISPFEELVLTAIVEAGENPDEMQVMRKAQQLAQNTSIRLMRMGIALSILEGIHCIESWEEIEPKPKYREHPTLKLRHYRILLRGEYALQAAANHRGSKPTPADFRRAGRFGIIWDLIRGLRSRQLASKQKE